MKYLLLSVLFLITGFTTNPIEGKSIKLGKEYKIESTFSGDTASKESFHLIIAKNVKKKQFEIIPISNTAGELKQLNSITFKKTPSILSFHKNKNTISLIVSKKGKKEDEFNIVDVNLLTGESTISKSISGKDYKTVIRKENENLLLFSNKEEIKVVKTTNATTINTIVAKGTKESKGLLKAIDKGSIDAINTNEFVANGSINGVRAYSDDNTIVISNENEKDGITYVSKIDFNDGEEVNLISKKYGKVSDEKLKKQTSYVSGGKLYQLKNKKKAANISIYNLDSNDKTDLNLNNVNISKKSKGFESVDDFIKKSSKSANEPTITINKTKKGNLSLRFDFVNKNEYNYMYNWWWHHHWMFHQQMMMMQHQQHVRNNIPRFGPSQIEDDFYFVAKEKHFFEIILDLNSSVLSNSESEETVFEDIDKQKHIKAIDDNTKIKHTSTVFIENKLIYFGFDKKTKSFRVIKKVL